MLVSHGFAAAMPNAWRHTATLHKHGSRISLSQSSANIFTLQLQFHYPLASPGSTDLLVSLGSQADVVPALSRPLGLRLPFSSTARPALDNSGDIAWPHSTWWSCPNEPFQSSLLWMLCLLERGSPLFPTLLLQVPNHASAWLHGIP